MLTQTVNDELPQNQTLQDLISDDLDGNLLDQNLTGINQMIRPQLDLTYLKEYQNNLPNLGQAYNDTPVTLTDHGGGKSRQ